MSAANNEQVQEWSDTRTRPRAEQVRALVIAIDGDTGTAFQSVYLNLTDSPDWADARAASGSPPPNALDANDLLSLNALIADTRDFIKNHASYGVVAKACVQPANVGV